MWRETFSELAGRMRELSRVAGRPGNKQGFPPNLARQHIPTRRMRYSTIKIGGTSPSFSSLALSRILQSGRELVLYFSYYSRRESVPVLLQEVADSLGIVFDQFAQRPRHGFDDHIVAVCDQHPADQQGACGISTAATRLVVERHRADQSGASTPAVGRARPSSSCSPRLRRAAW